MFSSESTKMWHKLHFHTFLCNCHQSSSPTLPRFSTSSIFQLLSQTLERKLWLQNKSNYVQATVTSLWLSASSLSAFYLCTCNSFFQTFVLISSGVKCRLSENSFSLVVGELQHFNTIVLLFTSTASERKCLSIIFLTRINKKWRNLKLFFVTSSGFKNFDWIFHRFISK